MSTARAGCSSSRTTAGWFPCPSATSCTCAESGVEVAFDECPERLGQPFGDLAGRRAQLGAVDVGDRRQLARARGQEGLVRLQEDVGGERRRRRVDPELATELEDERARHAEQA